MSKADDLRAQREAAQVAYEKASKSSRGGGEKQTHKATIAKPVALPASSNGVSRICMSEAGVASGPREYKSGGGPGPSTLAVGFSASPSESRRGGPDYKCPVCEARKVAARLRVEKHRAKKAAK